MSCWHTAFHGSITFHHGRKARTRVHAKCVGRHAELLPSTTVTIGSTAPVACLRERHNKSIDALTKPEATRLEAVGPRLLFTLARTTWCWHSCAFLAAILICRMAILRYAERRN